MAYYYEDYEDYPDERDPMEQAQAAAALADEMRREEDALSQISFEPPAPAITELPPGMGIPYSPGPSAVSSPFNPAIAPPGESDSEALARLQMMDQPGSRTIGYQSESPMSELSQAAQAAQRKYEAGQMYDFFVANGMAPADAMARSGAGLFAPSSPLVQKPMSAYQQAQVARWQQPPTMSPYQAAQVERWKAADAAKKTPIAEGVKLRYRSLIADEKVAMAEGDPGKINLARWAREGFEQQHPELMGESGASTMTGTTRIEPPEDSTGRVRMLNPQGRVGTLPANQVPAAIAKGWKRL